MIDPVFDSAEDIQLEATDPVFGESIVPSTLEAKNPEYKMGRVESAVGSAARGFGHMLSSIPKAIGEGAVAIANEFGDSELLGNSENEMPEDTWSYRLGQSMDKFIEENFPVNSDYEGEFLSQQLPSGAGSMLGFIAGGAAGSVAKVPVGLTVGGMGAAAGGVGGADDYIQTQNEKGEPVDPEERSKTFMLNGLLGTSEALPVQRLFDRIDRVSGGGVTRILKEGFKGGLEELTQEVFQQIGGNHIAANMVQYDRDRDLWEGTQEGAEVGFTLGFLLNSLGAAIGGRRNAVNKGSVDPVAAESVIGEVEGEQAIDPVFQEIPNPAIQTNEVFTQEGEFPQAQEFNEVDLLPKSPESMGAMPNQDEIDREKILAALEREQQVNDIYEKRERETEKVKKIEAERIAPVESDAIRAQELIDQAEGLNKGYSDVDESTVIKEALSKADKKPAKTFKTRKSAELHIKAKKLKGHIPVEDNGKWIAKESVYIDGRLEDESYRQALQNMGGDLQINGGGMRAAIDTGTEKGMQEVRTKSTNPDWAQNMLAIERTTVKDVWNAIDKAVKGERLGVKQARIVGGMLDEMDFQRERSDEEFQRSKQFNYNQFIESQREKALELREFGKNNKKRRNNELMQSYDQDAQRFAGELYEEDIYSPEMDGEARSLRELMEQASELGATEQEIESIVTKYDDVFKSFGDDKTIASDLFDLIEKRSHEQKENSGTDSPGEVQAGSSEWDQGQAAEILTGTEGGSTGNEGNRGRQKVESPPDLKLTNDTKAASSEAVSTSEEQSDMFGGKTDTEQALHDKANQRQKKIDNAPEVSEGDGDLFSDKIKQVDIEDIQKNEKAYEIEDGYRQQGVKIISSTEEYRNFSRKYGPANSIDIGSGVFGNKGGSLFIDDDTGEAVGFSLPEYSGGGKPLDPSLYESNIDRAANEAATSNKNTLPEPTEAQKEAGNYQKGHTSLHGLNIAIENPKGSKRSGKDRDGKQWSVDMKQHYGYIKRTEGADGDHVDVFLGEQSEDPNSDVYVVDQINPNSRRFDEHKVMMGYPSEEAAREAYLSNYEKGWQGIGGVKQFSLPEFKDWLKNGDTKKRVATPDKQKALKKKKAAKKNTPMQDALRAASKLDPELIKAASKMSFAEFHKRLMQDVAGNNKDWSEKVGYRSDDKDSGFSRWIEITGNKGKEEDFSEEFQSVVYGNKPIKSDKSPKNVTINKEAILSYDELKKQGWKDFDRGSYYGGDLPISGTSKDIGADTVPLLAKEYGKDGENEYLIDDQGEENGYAYRVFIRPLNNKKSTTPKQDALKAKSKKKNYGKKNTVFTEDAAEKARALLKSKLNNLNVGIDPEVMQAGITLAGYHIEAGARKFTDFAKAMTEDLGNAIAPYLRAFYEGVRYYPGIDNAEMTPSAEIDKLNIDEILSEKDDATSTSSSLESDSAKREASNDENAVQHDNGRAGSSNGRASGSDGKSRATGQRDNRVSKDSATTDRAPSNPDLFEQDGQLELTSGVTGDSERGRSDVDSDQGISTERERVESVEETAKTSDGEFQRKLALQKEAENIPVKYADLTNIEETLPLLFPEQQGDVLFAEERLADHRGVLFTNGTGTGKTFTGLGVIKREFKQGKSNILITVPSRKIAADWVKSGKSLGLNIHTLEDTKDNGNGVTVTTYANFGQNRTLANRSWDLVVHDESHRLSENEKGDTTSALQMSRALSGHPAGTYYYAQLKEPKLIDEIESLRSKIESYNKSDNQQLWAKVPALEEKLKKVREKFDKKAQSHSLEHNESWEQQKTKVLYLSATPFAYEKNVPYAEGFLFDYPKENEKTIGGYSHKSSRDEFFTENFGYRIRYGKLTQPEADVDSGLMQRQFNTHLKETGALRGRRLEVEHDYSREFVAIDDLVGNKIDEGLGYIREKASDKENPLAEGYATISGILDDKFNYHEKIRLLEAIKAKHAIPRIRKHMALGRKVVIFHSRIKGGGFHPFKFDRNLSSDEVYKQALSEFNRERKDLVNLDLSSLRSPLQLFQDEFDGDVTFYNGTLKNRDKLENPNKFNRDEGDKAEIIVVQDDGGKEGISLHDTSNKHQRVLINLGLPVKPTQSIQIEGRIYRVGQMSDAIFEYFNTGTNFERWTFASKIATRASVAENLALGEEARGLKESFIEAFEEPSVEDPSVDQGKGGKERDRALTNTITEFDRAKTFYFGVEKNKKSRAQREGADYFATPEPLGLKMVEWANPKPTEKVLEPSAGHGAIGRFFPETTDNTYIEPSSELGSKLALRAKGNIRQIQFESLDVGGNKFDSIVMNPPFGSGGKTAMDHVEKATKHLRNGGRVVALIPTGPAADKKFDKFMYSDDAPKNIHLVATIELPIVTFERAGTKVATRIVVLDRYDNPVDAPQHVTRDFTYSDKIKDFFDEIEDSSIPDRVTPTPTIKEVEAAKERGEAGVQSLNDAGIFVKETETKNGTPVWEVTGNTREHKDAIKALGGRWYGPKKAWSFYKGDPTEQLSQAISDAPKFSKQHTRLNGVYYADAVKIANDTIKSWKNSPKLEVVGQISGLPKHIRDYIKSIGAENEVEGLFAPKEKTIYLVANNLKDNESIQRVIYHEALGHYGLRELFGNDIKAILNKVYLSYGKSGLKEIADLYNLDLDNKNDRLIAAEEKLAQLAENNENPSLLNKIIKAIRDLIRKLGIDLLLNDSDIKGILANMRKAVTDDKPTINTGHVLTTPSGKALFSLKPEEKQKEFIKDISAGEPIDKAFQKVFEVLHIPHAAKFGRNKLEKLIVEKKFNDDGYMSWINPMLETMRAGIIDRYGLSGEYIKRDQQRETEKRGILTEGREFVEKMLDNGMTMKEAEIFKSILEGEQIPDNKWTDLAAPIRKALDDMGHEMVELGMLDAETYEKHRGSWLHRVYMNHESDKSSTGKWVSNKMAQRRAKLQGDQLRMRGMKLDLDMDRLLKIVPLEFWGRKKQGGNADKALKGEKFAIFDRLQHTGEGTQTLPGVEDGGKKAKVLERVYWPLSMGSPPAKYQAWESKGEWEVRDVSGKKVMLWRDFTKEERTNMGEILDARYVVAKTYMLMSNDLATGRFFSDISKNENWTWSHKDPPDASTIGKAQDVLNTFTGYEWVQVPETKLPGTQKAKWGALAGRYVRSEIWRDLHELNRMQTPNMWKSLLTQWKLNKTARNPVVHMNNVMSNFMLMDLADVRWRDFSRGMQAMKDETDDYKDALQHGVFGSSFVEQEIRKNILDSVLNDIKRQNEAEAETDEGKIKLLNAMWNKMWELDEKMIHAYQLEDEVFRMATYMRRLSQGYSKEDAAQIARDQFLNYDIRAPWINTLRNTVLPFISYTYRAVPVIAHSIAERPWKLAKYFTVAYMVNSLAYMLWPGDEDEERKSMDERIQGDTWIQAPRALRMWKNENNDPVFLDIRRWIPAGDVFDLNQGNSALPIPAPLQFGGPLMLAAEMALNKQSFTGREITDLNDTAGEKAGKIGAWAYRSWMPSALWIPGGWYWDKIERSVTGGRDSIGRDYSFAEALSSSVGIKLAPHDVKLGFEYHRREIDRIQSSLKFELKTLEKDKARGLISSQKYLKDKESIKVKLKRLENRAKVLFSN